MIKIEKTDVYGWEPAIRGMRNPMNSWDKSDSYYCDITMDKGGLGMGDRADYRIGTNDHDLMMRLAKAGSVHAKYRRMITVTVDITAPLYWWKEFDTYKVGTVANSCSTMHKIHAKEFTLDDFSHEHLADSKKYPFAQVAPLDCLKETIKVLNGFRDAHMEHDTSPFKDVFGTKKDLWWQMIQLLPSSYNQKRTIQLNYEVLAGMYRDRKNHKLDEWHTFCEWVEQLPYSEIITGC